MRVALLFCAVVSAGLFTQPADARWRARQQQDSQPEGLRDARGDRSDRSAQAARKAQAANGGGRVLSVEPEGTGYRVKVLKDGEVRTHHVEVN
jgi:hypothetical protein